jgi:hypothetical protein
MLLPLRNLHRIAATSKPVRRRGHMTWQMLSLHRQASRTPPPLSPMRAIVPWPSQSARRKSPFLKLRSRWPGHGSRGTSISGPLCRQLSAEKAAREGG